MIVRHDLVHVCVIEPLRHAADTLNDSAGGRPVVVMEQADAESLRRVWLVQMKGYKSSKRSRCAWCTFFNEAGTTPWRCLLLHRA
ncbi:hypothetical protein RSAG8_06351, partial [Rhizoctonia solani AG-8 WAC10335]